MATLLQKANEIKNEKDTKILPENIKKDVVMFGVTGTYEYEDSSDYLCFTANTGNSTIGMQTNRYINYTPSIRV